MATMTLPKEKDEYNESTVEKIYYWLSHGLISPELIFKNRTHGYIISWME